MNDFTRKLITEWRRLELPFDGGNFIIGVSGGADSCALAVGLRDLVKNKKLNNDYTVAHFNHGLRKPESDEDAKFVKELSRELGFKYVGGAAAEGEIEARKNTEQAARLARYKFLRNAAVTHSCNAVLTAHTKNDQAETMLLNLIRGSGLDGLAGMDFIRDMENEDLSGDKAKSTPRLVRVFLNWASRQDCEEFVKEMGVAYREDSMNHDLHYPRVRIRKQLLPLLSEFNPKIVETLARTAGILRNERNALDELEAESAELSGDTVLELSSLVDLSDSLARRRIRFWLKLRRGNLRGISQKHIDSIDSLAKSRKSGRIVEIPGGGKVRKEGGGLIFEPA